MIVISRAGEARLVETLNEITEQRDSWLVMVFHFSQLMEEYKNDYQIRIAVNLAHDLLNTLDGGIYICTNGDIAVLARSVTPQVARKLVFQLRYLYMDDPLAYHADGSENEAFVTTYALGTQFSECHSAFSRMMVTSIRAQRAQQSGQTYKAPPAPPPAAALPQFNALRLADIEKTLMKADLTKALRSQAICAFAGGVTPKRVYDETYIHIPHLREILHADVDFFSNKWLFKYLTQLLDRRMLTMLKEKKSTLLNSAISINVNMESLLSDEFHAFDAAIDQTQKMGVVFEVPVVDAFADTTGFLAACQNAQKRGYRICLDGLNETSFVQIKPQLLGVDMLKLQWNADYASELGREHRGLKEAVEVCGGRRVILCRCDSSEAVVYGQAMGIALYQGRYLDKILSPSAELVN